MNTKVDLDKTMIDRTPVSQTVARQIQKMIQSGEIEALQRLPSQRQLAEKLGVSRSSLREALMTLETLGFVKTYSGSGTIVCDPNTNPSPDSTHWRYAKRYDMSDVFEVRMLLEGRLAKHAAQTTTADDINILKTATDRMEAAWENNDLIVNVEEDQAFHQHIARKCRNVLLSQQYESIVPLLIETQRQPIPFTAVNRMAESIAEHRAIIKALHERDANAAEKAMNLHIKNTAKCAGVVV